MKPEDKHQNVWRSVLITCILFFSLAMMGGMIGCSRSDNGVSPGATESAVDNLEGFWIGFAQEKEVIGEEVEAPSDMTDIVISSDGVVEIPSEMFTLNISDHSDNVIIGTFSRSSEGTLDNATVSGTLSGNDFTFDALFTSGETINLSGNFGDTKTKITQRYFIADWNSSDGHSGSVLFQHVASTDSSSSEPEPIILRGSASDGNDENKLFLYGKSQSGRYGRLGTYAWLANAPYKDWNNYRLTLKMRSADNDAIGVMFKYEDPSNYYRFDMNSQQNYRRIVKCKDGFFTLLAEQRAGYTKNHTYDVRIEVYGGSIDVFLDGGKVLSAVDEESSFPWGSIAMYCWGNQGSVYDDVKVEDLSGSTLFSTSFSSQNDFMAWSIEDVLASQGGNSWPSLWKLENGAMVQQSNIVSRPGIYNPTPIIFVHGFHSGPGAWNSMLNKLYEVNGSGFFDKHVVWVYQYETEQRVSRSSAALKGEIAKYGIENPALVGHSMGGVVSRSYIVNDGGKFSKLVTLGTPHCGTPMGELGENVYSSGGADDIDWHSDFLMDLKDKETHAQRSNYVLFYGGIKPIYEAICTSYTNCSYTWSGIDCDCCYYRHVWDGGWERDYKPEYGTGYWALLPGYGDNDGMVPTSSAKMDCVGGLDTRYAGNLDHDQLQDPEQSTTVLNYLKDTFGK